ncbi:ubiquinol-cytochrome C reductase complex 14kD subunit domain-containing protein [Sarocladium implicatum]|nr:ubiquinol-cytochrome C reductase complex 14kD subunit domain-containing protein [Sarocladium implicatum]
MASLAPFIQKRPWLLKMVQPVAQWYMGSAGYRQMGLRYDDLLEEERPDVAGALKRLSPKESYERVYRIRRATQLSIQHKLLPKEEWTKPEEDTPYLSTIIKDIQAEMAEKDALDSMNVIRKH